MVEFFQKEICDDDASLSSGRHRSRSARSAHGVRRSARESATYRRSNHGRRLDGRHDTVPHGTERLLGTLPRYRVRPTQLRRLRQRLSWSFHLFDGPLRGLVPAGPNALQRRLRHGHLRPPPLRDVRQRVPRRSGLFPRCLLARL
jgi:hypothetical protein